MTTPNANYRATMSGNVAPPPDMIHAASASLTPDGFAALMEQTGGRAPTPAELCAAVEAERLSRNED